MGDEYDDNISLGLDGILSKKTKVLAYDNQLQKSHLTGESEIDLDNKFDEFSKNSVSAREDLSIGHIQNDVLEWLQILKGQIRLSEEMVGGEYSQQ